VKNPFRPQSHPENPTPGTSSTQPSAGNPDGTSTSRVKKKLQGTMPTNPTPVREPRVTGRREGESHKAMRRRRNG